MGSQQRLKKISFDLAPSLTASLTLPSAYNKLFLKLAGCPALNQNLIFSVRTATVVRGLSEESQQ
jgi:hypothetical protein